MAELDALWYHLEDLCDDLTAPGCNFCGQPMDLVPPEMLYYSCRAEFPNDFLWEPVIRDKERSDDVL